MTESDTALSPLYAQNPLGRFSNRAEDYAKYRPQYPEAALATILAGLGEPSNLTIADIGAGTGISSRLLANRGAKVWAIEPNAAMRDAAELHSLVKFQNAAAERTGLPDQSVDVVTCCQAFHWFEPVATLQEFHRILKPAGRVALMWNDRNLNDPFTVECTEIIRAVSDKETYDRKDRISPTPLANSTLFTNFRSYTFTYRHPLSLEGLIGLAQSASYVPKAGVAHTQLITDLQVLYKRWTDRNGESSALGVALSYNTNLYLADRAIAEVSPSP